MKRIHVCRLEVAICDIKTIAIREDLESVIGNDAFKGHMKDILEYRTMEYYRRRYAD